MPELPEVQTIVNELRPRTCGKTVTALQFHRANILQKSPMEIAQAIKGQTILDITRHGKIIAFSFVNGAVLTAHLRMTGKFVCVASSVPLHSHDRLVFTLSDGNDIRFNDVRTLGKINVCQSLDELKTITGTLGVDPMDPAFLEYDLCGALYKCGSAVKPFLMDGKNIAGIGNIYAVEILFDAGIHPEKPCNQISRKKVRRLQRAIVDILHEALRHNGTTISNYGRVDSKTGEFQNFLCVYGRNGKPCKQCGTTITRIVQKQRGTFFCPTCQP